MKPGENQRAQPGRKVCRGPPGAHRQAPRPRWGKLPLAALLPRRAGGVEEEEEEKEERGGGGGVFRGSEEQVALSAALGSGQVGSGTDTGSAPHRAMGSAGAALPPLLLALGRSVSPLWGGLRTLGRSLCGREVVVAPAEGGWGRPPAPAAASHRGVGAGAEPGSVCPPARVSVVPGPEACVAVAVCGCYASTAF